MHLLSRRATARTLFSLLAGAVVLAASGCLGGGGSSVPSTPSVPGIFVMDGNNRVVYLADMAGNGAQALTIPSFYNGAVDDKGRIYGISNSGSNNYIVRFDNIMGQGKMIYGGNAPFHLNVGSLPNPVRVAVDHNFRVFVVDRDLNQVIRFNSDGSGRQTLDLTPFFSSGAEPDVAFDSSNHMYIAGDAQVVEFPNFNATGTVSLNAPSGTSAFTSLSGICLDDSNRIYVTDEAGGGINRVVRVDDMSGANGVALGSTGSGTNEFDIAHGVSVDHNGTIYIADRNNHRIVSMDDMTGKNWTVLTAAAGSNFSFPYGINARVPTIP